MKNIELSRLQGPGQAEEAVIKEARRRQRRRQLITGVAVVLAVGGALGVFATVNGASHPRPNPTARESGPGHRLVSGPGALGPPRYYATEVSVGIQIHKAATGAVVARVPNPYAGHGSLGMFAAGVAAGDGGREFVAAYTGAPPNSSAEETRLYSFHLTSAGQVTGLSLVKGGVITGLDAGGVMAVSPDGSKVALTLSRPPVPGGPAPQPDIAVIDLRTGVQSLWTGGLQRSGFDFSIPSISWRAGGDSLVFLGQWCGTGAAGGFCAKGPHDAQVRTLRLATGGGRLSQGSVLLGESARYPNIVQALLSPNGKTITMVALSGPYLGKANPIPQDLQVLQVPLASGGRPRLLYHGVVGPHATVFLGSDASGRYLLLAWRLNGWIDHGVLHHLAPQGGYAFVDAW
jgi:hypothetical protein